MAFYQGDSPWIAKKRDAEKQMVTEMIRAFCRKHHHTGETICPECQALLEYAVARVEHCPRMETKTFCSKCSTHCYSEAMSRRIREVMRSSGPFMLLRHPVAVIRHMLLSMRRG